MKPAILVSLTMSLSLLTGVFSSARTQTFTKITTASNPIISDAGVGGFTGASWVDYDADGRVDLFVNSRGLYRNLGGGSFTRVAIQGNIAGSSGNSWADFDNDGDTDLMVAGSSLGGGQGSRLFRNDGAAGLVQIREGLMGDSVGLAGWSCAWGDYDADGRVDLVIANLAGTTSPAGSTSHLLRNLGGGSFARDLSTDVTATSTTHNIPSWSDFDLDGDLDLAIGSAPFVGAPAPDHFYRNLRMEQGTSDLSQITQGELVTAPRYGQCINWVDIDNDGDFDCFVSNYFSQSNHLFRNDDGVWTRVISAGAIVQDAGNNLSSVWGDYDNDGDLDCFVTRDNPANVYYRNDGNWSFTSLPMGLLTQVSATAGCAADYDADGDLDLFLGAPAFAKGLYRNDLAAGRHWLRIRLVGTLSNSSAIGARIRARAVIAGRPVWQLREVSAQSTFNGHSALEQHLGLGDATLVDSLIIEWPRGRTELLTAVGVDRQITVTEGDAPTPVAVSLASATVEGSTVSLSWHVGRELDHAVVERRITGTAWEIRGAARAASGRLVFVDRDVPAGTIQYRLSYLEEGALRYGPVTELLVTPAAPAIRASGIGRPQFEFWLPRPGRTRLALFDSAGRRVYEHDFGSLASGRHAHGFDMAGSPAGLYLVRLDHEAGSVSAKAILFR